MAHKRFRVAELYILLKISPISYFAFIYKALAQHICITGKIKIKSPFEYFGYYMCMGSL